MAIIVAATDEQWIELTAERPGIQLQRVNDVSTFNQYRDADAFFSLKDSNILPEFSSLNKPVFINSVIQKLSDLATPANVYRINGWATFLNRSVWEIAGDTDESTASIFNSLNIKITKVADEPGFITARIIAMIINEAFFAVEDNVSSKAEIDIAMKLGTNYPYGPFEWAEKIGVNNILSLLEKLSAADTRYLPAAQLIKEVKEKK